MLGEVGGGVMVASPFANSGNGSPYDPAAMLSPAAGTAGTAITGSPRPKWRWKRRWTTMSLAVGFTPEWRDLLRVRRRLAAERKMEERLIQLCGRGPPATPYEYEELARFVEACIH
jgi:hypothetical protein